MLNVVLCFLLFFLDLDFILLLRAFCMLMDCACFVLCCCGTRGIMHIARQYHNIEYQGLVLETKTPLI